ncbi:hypothetical protein ACT3TQ_13240 [Halomonas sp. AOP12-C2-37]|uniref:hypothetical protein n=1 Tax=unclassified Halomonas TaxID=2609666 RepID=UPI004033FD4C
MERLDVILMYAVPVVITLALIFVFVQIKRSREMRMLIDRERYMRSRMRLEEPKEDRPRPIQELLKRDDVTLRLLEEVHESEGRRYFRRTWHDSPDAMRLTHLAEIELELKEFLRDSVAADDFTAVRDRVLRLLDELRTERQQLAQKEPFNDIRDPEKSLLIDIFNELPAEDAIVRQKAVQLSNIMKLKHEDIAELQKQNARAASWTRWGTAGTVVFGLLSLLLSLAPLWTKSGAP